MVAGVDLRRTVRLLACVTGVSDNPYSNVTLRISLRIHHLQEHKTKKPLSLTPVEEPKSRGLRLPHSGSGSGLTAQFAAASTPSASSISTKGNRMQQLCPRRSIKVRLGGKRKTPAILMQSSLRMLGPCGLMATENPQSYASVALNHHGEGLISLCGRNPGTSLVNPPP